MENALSLLIEASDITRFIPHKDPFVLVDTLHVCEEKRVVTAFLVKPDHVLVHQGYLQEPGIIENIAQTVALKSGYEAKDAGRTAPPVGFIAAIKNVFIHKLVPVGETLLTEVEVVLKLHNMLLVKGKSSFGPTLVATCEMHLFLESE